MKIVFACMLGLAWPLAAVAQPVPFAVSERPAVGVFTGGSGSGSGISGSDNSVEVGLIGEVPIAMDWRVRVDASRVGFAFSDRDHTTLPPAHAPEPFTLERFGVGVVHLLGRNPRVDGYEGGGFGVYRFGFATTPMPHPYRGGIYGLVGFDFMNDDGRLAINPEVRVHAVNGISHAGVEATVLFKLDASISLKVRL